MLAASMGPLARRHSGSCASWLQIVAGKLSQAQVLPDQVFLFLVLGSLQQMFEAVCRVLGNDDEELPCQARVACKGVWGLEYGMREWKRA